MYFGSSESLHVPAQYITFDSHVYHQKSLFTLLVLIFGSFLLYYCLTIIIITLLKKYKKHASLYRYPKKCIKGRFMCNWVKGFRRSKLNLNSTTFQFTFSLLFLVPIHFRSPKILQPIAHELALKVFTKNFTIIYYLYRWL